MNRKQFFFEIVINAVLPYVVYVLAKDHGAASETQALLWATVIPAIAVAVGLIRQKKIDAMAAITLATLALSIALAAATEDARLLQLRESYLSAALGAAMLLSAVVGKPALLWLAPRLLPPERRLQTEHPLVKALLTRLTWIWGFIFASELGLKWWMVDHLTIGQVLALGPVVFAVITVIGCLLTVLAARSLRANDLSAQSHQSAEAEEFR